MPRLITVERMVRDDEDPTGHSVRSWWIRRDGSYIWIQPAENQAGPLMIQASDIEALCADLEMLAMAEEEGGGR